MPITPSVLVNVSGARGPLGIEIEGTPIPGQFLVKAPGSGRNYTTASGTGADAGLRTDLAGSGGAGNIGVLKSSIDAVTRPLDEILNDTVSVFDFIEPAEQAAIVAGTSVYDSTADITAAIAHVKLTGQTLRFVGGTYLVSIVTFDGGNYAVDTSAGVVFKQKTGVVADVMGGPSVVRVTSAQNITIGDLTVIGNIAADTGEDNHAVGISGSKNIRVGNIFGTNIRGDVCYCYARNTSDPERLSGVYIESVSGTNIFRNLLTVVGGQVRVGSVINVGPVGYRDFDVEPNNASGTYEAVDLHIEYARVGSAEITSDDAAVINHAVRIGTLDADFARVQATTPPYPSAPGSGAYALGVSRTESVEIGYFKARNYNLYPISLALAWGSVDIGTLDIANCSVTDTTFATMILQQGNAQGGGMRIGTLICDAANTKYLARVQGTGLLKIEVANIRTMKCLIGVQITGRFANGTININSSTGVALANSTNVVFENVTTTNHASATFTSGCTNVTAIHSPMFGQPGDGVNLVVGGSYYVAGEKVLTNRQSSLPAIATDLPTTIALANALRATHIAMGFNAP